MSLNGIPEHLLDERQAMFESDRAEAIKQAQALLARAPLIIDTETTGLDDSAEICEVAIIDHRSEVVLDTRVRPKYGIPEDASRIHGIRAADVARAPAFGEVLSDDLLKLLQENAIGIYNADFDLRMLRQSGAAVSRLDIVEVVTQASPNAVCLMDLYSKYAGDWSEYHASHTWQSLAAAARQCQLEWDGAVHSALADARMSLKVLRHVAGYCPYSNRDGFFCEREHRH